MPSEQDVEHVECEITLNPTRETAQRVFICPYCQEHLPIPMCGSTECSECGAHFRMKLQVLAPALPYYRDDVEDTES